MQLKEDIGVFEKTFYGMVKKELDNSFSNSLVSLLQKARAIHSMFEDAQQKSDLIYKELESKLKSMR